MSTRSLAAVLDDTLMRVSRPRLLMGLCMLVVGMGLGGAAALSVLHRGRPVAVRAERELAVPAHSLVPNTRVIDLGIVPQGGSSVEFFSFTNRTPEMVRVGRIQTSCECVEVALARSMVAPGETVIVRVALDLAHSPDFCGELAVEATGHGELHTDLFNIEIDAHVVPGHAFDEMLGGSHISYRAAKPGATP